jgi:hypothetical protein
LNKRQKRFARLAIRYLFVGKRWIPGSAARDDGLAAPFFPFFYLPFLVLLYFSIILYLPRGRFLFYRNGQKGEALERYVFGTTIDKNKNGKAL